MLFLKPVDRTLAGRLVDAHVSHFVTPGNGQLLIMVPASQLFRSALQCIMFYVSDSRLNDPLSIRDLAAGKRSVPNSSVRTRPGIRDASMRRVPIR